ncbi:MAG: phage major capsid protein [Dehalococcoidia bacterium]|nr:phage major capsid protein [Dehalococcoidia bacterium]MDW8119476.1 phage major capsid protein [Chloroflexota bacterium]
MALTLAEASKLSNDVLLRGVIETIVQESPVLQMLPFIEVVGNGLTYVQENTLPSAHFYDVGDTWAESTPTFTQVTATLRILGGDADIDNFLRTTRSNIQDLEAAVVHLKAKALRMQFEDAFVNGDTATNPKAFDGLDKLTPASQTVSMGANGGSLTLEKLDELIDKVRGGKPHVLLMSRRSRRKLSALARGAGSGLLVTDRNQFGQMVDFYDGIPVAVNDFIPDNKTVGTAHDCSTIYALQFGEGAVMGLTAPGGLTIERVGSLESKDATRIRVKWYVSIAVFNTLKVAKLVGVRP